MPSRLLFYRHFTSNKIVTYLRATLELPDLFHARLAPLSSPAIVFRTVGFVRERDFLVSEAITCCNVGLAAVATARCRYSLACSSSWFLLCNSRNFCCNSRDFCSSASMLLLWT